jgi:Tryptophan-rich Synechocystis species C-terminal domain
MTTYVFQPTTTEQFVDWSDPDVWVGGVVPDGASADVVFPVVTLGNGDGTDYSYVYIASDESYSVGSVSLASNYLTLNGDLTVATDLAIQAGGEIDMGGATLAAGTLENEGSDIQGYGQVDTTGILTNNSLIGGNGLTLTLGGLVNNGTLEATGGNLTVQVPSGFAELSDGTLTGGTYAAAYSGTLYLDVGGVVTTDGATISLDNGGEIDSFDSESSTYVSIESTLNLIAAAGSLSLADQTVDWEAPLTVAGTLSLSDEAVLDAAQLTVDAGGVVNGIGTIDGAIANSGVIFAGSATPPPDFETVDGELDIQGAITGDGTIEIAPEQLFMLNYYQTATLELGGPDSENVSFADGTGTLQLDDPTAFSGTLRPADSGDQIILAGVSYPSVTGFAYVGNAAGGTLTINAGGAMYSLRFAGDFDTASFSLSAGPQLFTTSPPSLLITPTASEPTTVIQTDGGVTLVQMGGANGEYVMELGNGTGLTLNYQGAPVTGGEFGAWAPIGAALLGSGDYEVAWKNATTGLYTVWDTDANGDYLSDATGSVAGSSLALEVLELGFDQDLNGDGAIGPPSSVPVTTIDAVDGTTLLQISAAPDAEYVIEGGNAFEPVLSNQGVPYTGGAYTPIAAAELASGGYEVAFQDAATGQYTVWDTDGNGDYVSDPIGAAAGSNETAEDLGTIFALPAVQHLPVTTIRTDGAITLAEVGDEYVIEDGSGFGPWLENNDSPVTAGQFADWTPIGAALLASGGYEVAWRNTATGQFTVWNTDANGNYVSSPIGAVSRDSYALEALEPSFQQDLNGDGTIGPTKTVIDTLDGTTLAQLGAVSGEYALENSGGSGPTLSNNGSPVTSGAMGAWTPIAAAELAWGGYEVAWRNSATDQYTVWATDANGNYLGDVTGAVASGSQTADVLAALFQLPGAPSLSLIHTDGATSLDEVDGEYVMLGGDGFGPWLEMNNSPVTAGQFGAWTPIGAAELPAGGYEIAWKNATTGLYTVWYANADGDYVTSLTGGAVSGMSLGLEVLEWSFGQDLNGDGVIGPPPTLITPIRTDGSTTLADVAGEYVFEVNGAPGQSLDLLMTPVSVGEIANWAPIGAAQLASGGFEVAWEDASAGQYTVWNTDANGDYVSAPIGIVSGSSLALENLEWSFGQDLNGDGTIGPPSSVPSTVIQTDGSTTLAEFGATNGEYVMEGSGGTGQALEYQNLPVTAGQFGDWTPIGAAQLEAGGYEVAWKNTATGLFTVWDTDADGNYVSDPIASVSGSSFALEDLEPSFQQDLNGDGFLSTQLITTGDTVDLTGQTEPTTINLGENDTAHASGGLNASSLTIVGTPDAITLGSGADIVEYALAPGSGVETIANFSLGQDMLNIDLNGAPPSSLEAYDTSLGGAPAIAFASTADPAHGVVLTGLSPSLTAADLLASHTTFTGGHALIT